MLLWHVARSRRQHLSRKQRTPPPLRREQASGEAVGARASFLEGTGSQTPEWVAHAILIAIRCGF